MVRESASEAGLSVAALMGMVAGRSRVWKRAKRGGTRGWKALWIGKAGFVDAERVEVVLVLRRSSGRLERCEVRQRVSEAGSMQLVARLKTPCAGDVARCDIRALQRSDAVEWCAKRLKLGSGVNRNLDLGLEDPQGDSAPQYWRRPSGLKSDAVIAAKAASSGIERYRGCT